MLEQRGVRAHASNQPRHFYIWGVGPDCEVIVLDLAGYNSLGELSQDGELISEVAVDCLEPIGQHYYGIASLISGDVAGIDIQDFGRFDSGVVEILVLGIERMIDFE